MEFENIKIEELPVIFGLTYLEEEAAEIEDVVGCLLPIDFSGTSCDDSDQGYQIP